MMRDNDDISNDVYGVACTLTALSIMYDEVEEGGPSAEIMNGTLYFLGRTLSRLSHEIANKPDPKAAPEEIFYPA